MPCLQMSHPSNAHQWEQSCFVFANATLFHNALIPKLVSPQSEIGVFVSHLMTSPGSCPVVPRRVDDAYVNMMVDAGEMGATLAYRMQYTGGHPRVMLFAILDAAGVDYYNETTYRLQTTYVDNPPPEGLPEDELDMWDFEKHQHLELAWYNYLALDSSRRANRKAVPKLYVTSASMYEGMYALERDEEGRVTAPARMRDVTLSTSAGRRLLRLSLSRERSRLTDAGWSLDGGLLHVRIKLGRGKEGDHAVSFVYDAKKWYICDSMLDEPCVELHERVPLPGARGLRTIVDVTCVLLKMK